MAVQKADNKTLPLVGVPKKRGRPATGKALSGAERQARHRAWLKIQRQNSLDSVRINLSHLPDIEVKSQVFHSELNSDRERNAWIELGARRGWLK